jgi:hypothetical protein
MLLYTGINHTSVLIAMLCQITHYSCCVSTGAHDTLALPGQPPTWKLLSTLALLYAQETRIVRHVLLCQ